MDVNGCCCDQTIALSGSKCASKKLFCCLRFYPRMMIPAKQKWCVYCICVLKCLQPVGPPSFEDVKHLNPRRRFTMHSWGLLCRQAQVQHRRKPEACVLGYLANQYQLGRMVRMGYSTLDPKSGWDPEVLPWVPTNPMRMTTSTRTIWSPIYHFDGAYKSCFAYMYIMYV